jgi:hypothetical protein
MGHYDDYRAEYDANPAEYIRKFDERARDSHNMWFRQANAIAENERLRSLMLDVVSAWDWWQIDPSDRCSTVPGNAIESIRNELKVNDK